MEAGTHFELWMILAIVAVFVGTFMSYLLVELPGRFLIRSVIDDFEPTRWMSRAVGSGLWGIVIVLGYAVMN
jgi:hypothetical protein